MVTLVTIIVQTRLKGLGRFECDAGNTERFSLKMMSTAMNSPSQLNVYGPYGGRRYGNEKLERDANKSNETLVLQVIPLIL